jgi:N-acetylmuramoyl-L-alanine amidase
MIAICVGHSRQGDDGAVSVGGVAEWRFNKSLAQMIYEQLERVNVPCQVIDCYGGATYSAAMRWLGRDLAKRNPALAAELHFNDSDNREASGHEWLYWHESNAGREAARCMDRSMRLGYGNLKARGVKGLTGKDRGALFLKATPCPAIICEPFFGSNVRDWELIDGDPLRLARRMADGLACAHDILTGKAAR